MLIDARRDRIAKVRAIGGAGDSVGTRHAIERALAGVELRPRGFPASAIFCVRHLRAGTPPRDARAWAKRLDARVQDLAAVSARPFHESVPASAPAVVFFDEAELLACLARDWRQGDGDAWWWRGLFGEPAREVLVERVFTELAEHVPAAIERLTHMRIVGDVVGALSPAFCVGLGSRIATVFAVADWNSVVESPTMAVDASASVNDAAPAYARLATALRALAVPSDAHTLPVPQRALLALAVTLRQAPTMARRAGFAAAVRDYVWQVESPIGATEAGRHFEASGLTPRALDIGVPRVAPPTTDERSYIPVDIVGALVEHQLRGATAPDANDPPIADAPTQRANTVELERDVGGASSIDASLVVVEHHIRRPHATPYVVSYALPYTVSDFAGAVYVVNLALQLELYGDFTQPLRPGLALPLGDFLALVGEHACGPAIRDDVVWTILARLAGRADTDEPQRPDDFTELITPLASHAARALAQTDDLALAYLCARPGRVSLSPTRIDVAFSLADHPLAIRMSGLDRNPGWVPAAGRLIEFHYE